MRDFSGRTAFVTGGASGIGLAFGQAFVAAGMNVMLADVDAPALEQAVALLRRNSPGAQGVLCDVTDAGAVERAASRAFEVFGKVHVLCNNAGVAGGSGIDNFSLSTWRWVLDVNMMGMLHGVAAFLPHIRAHGEGGHIVNTAAMAGFQSRLGFSPYATSKYAVVAMSEGLAQELPPEGIGVTILSPGFVRTRISDSGRNRPARYGFAAAADPERQMGTMATHIAALVQAGTNPADIAARTLDAIRADQLYLFTHPEARSEIDDRFSAITAALEAAGHGH
jgi:NAD(P)-dependent dehydrogenase (short-subunit alcohol dehydrogenase family)